MHTSNRHPTPSIIIVAAILCGTLSLAGGCGEDVQITVSETKVSLISEKLGKGKQARNGDVVCVDYRVETEDGEEIMWGKDFCFQLGAGAVIAAVDEAAVGMQSGGRRVVRCPSHKHWGSGGYADKIPPRAMLILHLKLTSIE